VPVCVEDRMCIARARCSKASSSAVSTQPLRRTSRGPKKTRSGACWLSMRCLKNEDRVLVKSPDQGHPLSDGTVDGHDRTRTAGPFKTLKLEFYGGNERPSRPPRSAAPMQRACRLPRGPPACRCSGPATLRSHLRPRRRRVPGATLPFAPALAAESTSTTAGAFTPLSTSVGREDGQQDLQGASVTFPGGVSAVLTGVPECGKRRRTPVPAGWSRSGKTRECRSGQDPTPSPGEGVFDGPV